VVGVGEDSHAADLVAGALFWHGDDEVGHALVDVLDAVVREDDARRDLAAAGLLAGSRARLAVLQHVRVELAHVVEPAVLTAAELDLGPERRVRGAGGSRVGGADLRLERGVEQVFPRLGNVCPDRVEHRLVGAEAEHAEVDAGPVALGVAEALRDLLGVLRHVRLEQAGILRGGVAIGRAAVPDVELRVVLAGLEAGDSLAARKANVVGVDAGLLLEGGGDRLAPILLRTAGDDERLVAVSLPGALRGLL
jgi:hypothetical protein